MNFDNGRAETVIDLDNGRAKRAETVINFAHDGF